MTRPSDSMAARADSMDARSDSMGAGQRTGFSLLALVLLSAVGVKLHELDMPVVQFVRSFNDDAINYSGDLIALLGQGVGPLLLFALIGLIGWKYQRDRLYEVGVRGVVAMLSIAVVVQLLKHLIGRPRPRLTQDGEFVLSPSLTSGWDAFPSGHTTNAFGTATVLAWYLPALRIPLFVTAGLVALARVVRGSHFPTDVFAGAVVGVLVGSLAVVGLKRWHERALPGLLRVGVPCMVAVFLVVWIVLHPAQDWSQASNDLGVGAVLVLVGSLRRGLGDPTGQGGPSRAVGNMLCALGITVAVAPWWAGPLMLIALAPMSLVWLQGNALLPEKRLPVWWRESLAVGSALLAIAALHVAQGLLPIG